jgi:hypothetical protein
MTVGGKVSEAADPTTWTPARVYYKAKRRVRTRGPKLIAHTPGLASSQLSFQLRQYALTYS